MDVNEALQWADQWTEGHTFYEGMQGWRVVCATLAAEVRRQRENLTQLLTGLECRNIELAVNENTPDAFKLVGELIAHRAKQNTGYPPALDVCNMEYMGNSVGHIYQKMEAYRYQLGQVKTLDADTRKLVLELLDELDTYSLDPYLSRRSKEIVKILKEKLGAGE